MNDNSFIVLTCDIEDIKQQYPNKTKDEILELYDKAKEKLSDIIMDDYWRCIDALEFC